MMDIDDDDDEDLKKKVRGGSNDLGTTLFKAISAHQSSSMILPYVRISKMMLVAKSASRTGCTRQRHCPISKNRSILNI
jgi:hypothetical protein